MCRFVTAAGVILMMSFAAHADIGTIDAVPAATLLLPYFEVDLSSPDGATTLFAINNASPDPAIAHVTLWTDLSVGTLNFDVMLSGYDVAPINLRDIFNGTLPGGGALGDDALAGLVAAHTGQPDPSFPDMEMCSGVDFGDDFARGYITVDVMNETGAGFPFDNGYFASGGTGLASNDNVLWGDYSYVDPANNFAQGMWLVAIEASGTDAAVTTDGNRTFYGRYVGMSAIDNREPLASQWDAPYDTSEDTMAATQYVYWRDPNTNVMPFPCGPLPSPFPLTLTDIVAFDENENPEDPENLLFMPNACGRASVESLDLAFESGWIFLNLNIDTPSPEVSQSFVTVVTAREGRFSSGFQATPLDNVTQTKGLDRP